MARGAQIPLDDEPVDIDLGDLPTDEELEAAATAGPDDQGDFDTAVADYDEPSALALFQLWTVLVAAGYVVIGLAFGLMMAFQGAAQLGLAALTSPRFYLVVLFWPIAAWQLFWGQF